MLTLYACSASLSMVSVAIEISLRPMPTDPLLSKSGQEATSSSYASLLGTAWHSALLMASYLLPRERVCSRAAQVSRKDRGQRRAVERVISSLIGVKESKTNWSSKRMSSTYPPLDLGVLHDMHSHVTPAHRIELHDTP